MNEFDGLKIILWIVGLWLVAAILPQIIVPVVFFALGWYFGRRHRIEPENKKPDPEVVPEGDLILP